MKNPYKNDYAYNPRLTPKGRIVDDICYVGDYYILSFDKHQKTKTAVYNLLFSVVILALQILDGCINQSSSRTFWIVFPYLFRFIPIGYFFLGAISYWQSPVKMQKIQYERGILRMRHSGIGILLFTSVGAALDILYMLLYHASMQAAREAIFFLLHIAIVAVVLLFSKYYDRAYGGLEIKASQNRLE